MDVGNTIYARGFFTKALYMRGVSSSEVEKRLGYRQGRLAGGWTLLFMLSKPFPGEFQFRGYSQTSGGVSMGHLANPKDPRNSEQKLIDDGFDMKSLKGRIINETFKTAGAERLAKVIPKNGEFGDADYPPGSGIPQWTLTKEKAFKVAAIIMPGEKYMGNYE